VFASARRSCSTCKEEITVPSIDNEAKFCNLLKCSTERSVIRVSKSSLRSIQATSSVTESAAALSAAAVNPGAAAHRTKHGRQTGEINRHVIESKPKQTCGDGKPHHNADVFRIDSLYDLVDKHLREMRFGLMATAEGKAS
jgi:hypothetical protein